MSQYTADDDASHVAERNFIEMAGAREKIVARIRKLLALASRGATEEEAALATRRAHELLAEHNLEMPDIDEGGDDDGDRVLDESSVDGKRKIWPVFVWHATSDLHFCRYFYTNVMEDGKRIGLRHTVVGRRHNVEVTKLTAQYLIATVDRLADESGRSIPACERGAYRASFRRACGIRLAQRVYALRQEPTSDEGPGSESNLPALVSLYLSEKARNDDLLQKRGIEIGSGESDKDRLTHAGGAEAGRRAAETIGLHRQISGTAGRSGTGPTAGESSNQLDLFA